MTPYQMVKNQCDCHQPDGSCLGVTLDDNLKLVRFLKEGSKCLISLTPFQRCQHFEACILGRKLEHRDARVEAKMQSEWSEGAHTYRIKTGYMAEQVRLCPQCRSNKIGRGRKICDQCRLENRVKTKSNYDRESNSESDSHSSLKTVVDGQ